MPVQRVQRDRMRLVRSAKPHDQSQRIDVRLIQSAHAEVSLPQQPQSLHQTGCTFWLRSPACSAKVGWKRRRQGTKAAQQIDVLGWKIGRLVKLQCTLLHPRHQLRQLLQEMLWDGAGANRGVLNAHRMLERWPT